MKKRIRKFMACFAISAGLLISGCKDSSKDQIIAVYDYSDNTEKEYGTENKTADDLVNQFCDYFLYGESEAEEIPDEAVDFKRIDVFQTDGHASSGQQKTDETRIIHIELYQYGDEVYCKACFGFSDQEYTAKLPAEISAQVEKLETERQ